MGKVAALVPDRPEVHVAFAVVVPCVAEIHRAGRGRGGPPQGMGGGLFEGGLDGAVQAVVVDEVAVAVVATFVKPAQRADQLVVAAP